MLLLYLNTVSFNSGIVFAINFESRIISSSRVIVVQEFFSETDTTEPLETLYNFIHPLPH